MEPSQQMTPRQGMRVSARLVVASHLLQLDSQGLQQAIYDETAENPALEVVEQPVCPVCGTVLQGDSCPSCRRTLPSDPDPRGLAEHDPDTIADRYIDDYAEFYPYRRSAGGDADEFDPLTIVASPGSLTERLLADLSALVPPQDLPIGEYLVGSLDDRGYLTCSVEDAAYDLSVPDSRVNAVLASLRTLDPIGVGARDARECLLIQLDYLDDNGFPAPTGVRQIVERHLSALAAHGYGRIAASLKLPLADVHAAALFIRRQLCPFPVQSSMADSRGSGAAGPCLTPDVIISRRPPGLVPRRPDGGEVPLEDEFEIDVVEARRYRLRVAPFYQRLADDLRREPGRFSEADKQHVREYVSRASLFIANVDQRRRTLLRVSVYVAEAQRDFLRMGASHIRPLTRAAAAAGLKISESTVSRATAGRYVMLPDRRVVPFAEFFTASLPAREAIRELIAGEATPLTDHQIAAELARRGTPVARRTVAKYREQSGILPSPLR